MRWTAIGALLASLFALSGCDETQGTARKTTVSPREVYERRSDEKVLIVDVRTPAEYRHERIEQAVNKPLDSIEKWLPELPKDKTIYFVCRSGNRSGIAQRIAAQKGLANTYNMEGGMIAWHREGLPVVSSD
ncbi:MAG: rhodanese-like domain-containing protein [Fimbriimonadales bacterium]|nr:MAG: sulfurtransferase [Fimbriimonadales bacterium]